MNQGSLTVFTGPMCSGKSSSMYERLIKHSDTVTEHCGGPRPLYINHSLDFCRSESGFFLHSKSSREPSDKQIDRVSVSKLSDVNADGREVIGIDEGQFFPDLFSMVTIWIGLGKQVIVAALSSDAQMKSMGEVHLLLPIAEEFYFLRAICYYCLLEFKGTNRVIRPGDLEAIRASFTLKLEGDSTKQVDVGDAISKYKPVCRSHHVENLRKLQVDSS